MYKNLKLKATQFWEERKFKRIKPNNNLKKQTKINKRSSKKSYLWKVINFDEFCGDECQLAGACRQPDALDDVISTLQTRLQLHLLRLLWRHSRRVADHVTLLQPAHREHFVVAGICWWREKKIVWNIIQVTK